MAQAPTPDPPAKPGDAARAEELRGWMARHSPALRAFFRKRVRAADIDDLVQEVFLRLHLRADAEPVENVERYLFRVAASVLVDSLRRDTSRGWTLHDPLDLASDPVDHITPERALIGKQDHTSLVLAISRLPPRMRAAFMFHRYEQMTYPAIARRMGNSPSAVKQMIRKAFERLAQDRKGR